MKKIVLVTVSAILALMLAACSPLADEFAQSTAEYGYDDSADYYEEPAEYDAVTEETAVGDTVADSEYDADSDYAVDNATSYVLETDRKLIYTADYSISTDSFDEDYNKVLELMEKYGGYLESEYTYGSEPKTSYDYGRSSSLYLRIPVDNYDAFLNDVSNVGELESKNISSEDISERYYDIDARIKLLEERKARLEEYMAAADNVEDMMAVESQISDVLYELDSLKSDKKSIDGRIEYSQVTVNLRENVTTENIDESRKKDVGERANEAFNMGWTGVGEFFESFAIGFMAALPALIIAAIIVVIILVVIKVVRILIRKFKKNRSDKK